MARRYAKADGVHRLSRERARVTGIDVTGGTYAPFVVDGEQWRIFLVLAGTTRL